MAKAKKALPQLQDRIADFRRIPARELKPHAQNWRVHPGHCSNMILALQEPPCYAMSGGVAGVFGVNRCFGLIPMYGEYL